jgi:hypothetical protein
MRTPSFKVDTIRHLFAEATPAAREAFGIHAADPWGFNVTLALFQATRP